MSDDVGADRLSPALRLVRAPNPSPMTYTGTNTWIVGTGETAVIDPGPDVETHFHAILAALSPGETVVKILVTHAHRDHSPLARRLSAATGAPVLAAGAHVERRRPVMAALASKGLAGGGEGIDAEFAPDRTVNEGDVIAVGELKLQAIATPGHTADHMAFAWRDAVFTGDHVMGWASSLVSPPDGDLTAFMASCARLQARKHRIYYPGHGDPVEDPAARLAWLIQHRRRRDEQVAAALAASPGRTAAELARAIYTDTPASLLPAAERNVLAHLIAAWETGRVRAEPELSQTARFFPAA